MAVCSQPLHAEFRVWRPGRSDPVFPHRAVFREQHRPGKSHSQLGGDSRSYHAGARLRLCLDHSRSVLAAGRKISRGTGILATIGATAPFVGLFGTVWGIMDSFIGISKAHTTNLAVVAPGIAEALLATALGLVAAIPAVMIYNVLARSTAHYRALIGDASALVMNLVSRDLDRAKLPLPHAAE